MVKRYVSVTILAVVLVLTAVAGVSALETTTRTANAASYVTVRGCTGTNLNLTTTVYRSFYLHNQTRARYSLPGFCVHPSLHNAARAHSAEMVTGRWARTSPTTARAGRPLLTRCKASG